MVVICQRDAFRKTKVKRQQGEGGKIILRFKAPVRASPG